MPVLYRRAHRLERLVVGDSTAAITSISTSRGLTATVGYQVLDGVGLLVGSLSAGGSREDEVLIWVEGRGDNSDPTLLA